MRLLGRWLWFFALLGCNEVTTPSTARLTLSVSAWDPEAESQLPLQDVQLCQTDTAICDLSNAEGQVSIELPIGEETSYTLKKDGHPSYLVPVVIASAEEVQNTFYMATDGEMRDQFNRVDSFYPMLGGTGAVEVWVFPEFAGVTFDLANATSKAYYAHERGEWRDDLTATTRRGGGGFVEVPPGEEFQVNLGGTAAGCGAIWGWLGDDAKSIRFPVREGYMTRATLNCPRPSTVQLWVTVNEAVEGLGDPFTGPLLEGAEVCETDDTSNCATTDADGEARLLLPANEEISYTVTKDKYAPFLAATLTGDGPGFSRSAFMVSDAQMADLAEDLGIEYPLTGGIVALRAHPLRAGVTYDLVDKTTAVGYYNDEAGTPTLGLTATTSNGRGGFLEVTPDEHQIEFGGTATNCSPPWHGWPGDAENRIKVPVKVGHITSGITGCDEP